jgi:hypothetical protein
VLGAKSQDCRMLQARSTRIELPLVAEGLGDAAQVRIPFPSQCGCEVRLLTLRDPSGGRGWRKIRGSSFEKGQQA